MELLFKNFFERSTEMLCIANHEGFLVKVNEAFREKLGYTEEELLSIPYISLVHEKEVEDTIREAKALAKGQVETLEFENRYRKKDGGYILLSWNAYSDYESKLFYCVVSDVTERKLKESRLRKIELFYREAQKAAKIGSWELDLLTNEVFWSDETYKIHETDPESYTPVLDQAINFYDEESRPQVEKFVGNALKTGEGWEYVLGINTLKGNHKWVHSLGKVDFDDKGNPIRVAGTFQDVTEAKVKEFRREQFLTGLKTLNSIASNANLSPASQLNEALIFASRYLSLPVAIISQIKGNIYTIIHAHSDNPDIKLETGTEFELGQTYCSITLAINDVVSIEDMGSSEYSGHPCYEAFALESYIGCQIEIRGKLYGTINFSSPKKREKFEEYEIEFVRLLSKWVSSVLELKFNQDELVKAKIKAEKAATAKTEFLSVMSHEIRTPLNSIIGMTNLLILDDPKEDQVENLSVLKTSSENLLALINDILDFNKLDSGNFKLSNEPTDLRELISNTKKSFDLIVAEKGIGLAVDFSEAIPDYVLLDAKRLTQVVINLLSNAIKFTEKGEVKVTVGLEEKGEKNVVIKFSVSDTGIGIHEDYQKKIFERFTQASTSTTRQYGGTGLGLAITKNILMKMGSTIVLKSALGKGSTFSFMLETEYLSKEKSETTVAKRLTGKDLGGLYILVAEDNEFNRVMLSKFLDRWDVKYEFVENGLEAVNRVDEVEFDIVFMDLQMPVMDGYEASRLIKEKKPGLSIIALTASSELEIQKKAKRSGMSTYITKPFTPDQLLEKLQELNLKIN